MPWEAIEFIGFDDYLDDIVWAAVADLRFFRLVHV